MGDMARPRGRETVTDMLRSMAVVGVVVAGLFLVVWWQRPEGLGPDVRTPVDPAGVVAAVRLTDPFPVLEPTRLPDGWTPTSAWFEPDDATTDAAFLHLGYTTPDGSYAEVRQTHAPRDDVVPDWTDHGSPTGSPVVLAGLTWTRLESADTGKRALVSVRGSGHDRAVVVVTGKADWPELEQLAASLR